MTTLTDWIDACCADLGLDRDEVVERVILDLARDVAHGVDRPAAPVTAFLLGLAVGGGAALPETACQLTAKAAAWPAPDAPG